MTVQISFNHWIPLSVNDVLTIFTDAPFAWCLAGGYAVEQFLGTAIRTHSDIDIVIFRHEQLKAQQWLKGWQLYAADPPGTLRTWDTGEYLPFGIHDIWAHQQDSKAWQLQIMLAEAESDEWFSRQNSKIRGRRAELMVEYNGILCIRIEVQLLYKARRLRPKDDMDFQACLPLLSIEARTWLRDSLQLLYPQGHAWLNLLSR